MEGALNGGKPKTTRILVWLRNDLRLMDNYCFNWATKQQAQVLPIFCFDPRYYDANASQTEFGTRKTGLVRARFQLEAVACLRKNLQAIKSNLLVSFEKPEDFIPKLLDADAENIIVYQREVTSEELKIEQNVKKAVNGLKGCKTQMKGLWGLTLEHIDDMGFDPQQELPSNFTGFWKDTSHVPIRPLVPAPKLGELPFEVSTDLIKQSGEYMPTLEDFGLKNEPVDERTSFPWPGGEDSAQNRLADYMQNNLHHYAETRNGLMGLEYSSKFSPFFANGTLSIRQAYFKTIEKKFDTKNFVSELFWRDFFKFWFMRHGNKAFASYGPFDRINMDWKNDPEKLQRWKDGQTGIPLIDAFMRELNATGFMSNRGRQIVASFLTHDLRQDWRYGAHYFEEKLIDEDVTSNYGGWNSCSGIGPGRVMIFNVMLQSKKFDPDGKFIKTWCPELSVLPLFYLHEPWKALFKAKGYPDPIRCRYTHPNEFRKQRQESKGRRKMN